MMTMTKSPQEHDYIGPTYIVYTVHETIVCLYIIIFIFYI